MASWTDELKAKAVEMYCEGKPTAENSPELVKEIADELEQSPNGVRMVLVQAGVYVKKEASSSSSGASKKDGEGSKRVSKESQISALKELIRERGKDVDDEILGKLTGKAAQYLFEVFKG